MEEYITEENIKKSFEEMGLMVINIPGPVAVYNKKTGLFRDTPWNAGENLSEDEDGIPCWSLMIDRFNNFIEKTDFTNFTKFGFYKLYKNKENKNVLRGCMI